MHIWHAPSAPLHCWEQPSAQPSSPAPAPTPTHALLAQECDAHIGAQIRRLAREGSIDTGVFLAQVAAAWTDHTAHMLTLRSIFLYLDRTYVAGVAGARSLFDMGLQLFCAHLDLHPEVGVGAWGGICKESGVSLDEGPVCDCSMHGGGESAHAHAHSCTGTHAGLRFHGGKGKIYGRR